MIPNYGGTDPRMTVLLSFLIRAEHDSTGCSVEPPSPSMSWSARNNDMLRFVSRTDIDATPGNGHALARSESHRTPILRRDRS